MNHIHLVNKTLKPSKSQKTFWHYFYRYLIIICFKLHISTCSGSNPDRWEEGVLPEPRWHGVLRQRPGHQRHQAGVLLLHRCGMGRSLRDPSLPSLPLRYHWTTTEEANRRTTIYFHNSVKSFSFKPFFFPFDVAEFHFLCPHGQGFYSEQRLQYSLPAYHGVFI